MSFISEDTVSASMDMDMGDIKGDVVVVVVVVAVGLFATGCWR